ncbi:class A beta-lactamase [Sphingorhabdus sp. Alg239-R122]|uniref:class A beta-lactamase n=1 Tax=Sphingorhabdus sp. Alg239-R122 TaxID=2305989 RepID=UPI0013D99F2B|nr:class A beta-lactamase [Sphingorhabdus sp. Alg239-R122]
MMPIWSRRTFLSASLASFALSACKQDVSLPVAVPLINDPALRKLEQESGGRLGVACINAAGDTLFANRADERFAMCSTFKAPLAAALFEAHDRGIADRFARIRVREDDFVPYAPFTENLVKEGQDTTLDEMAYQAVIISDNAAANIVLRAIGGPEAFTDFLRRQGDDVTRLDRYEPELNENAIDDPRDTTSPLAMAGLLRRLLLKNEGSAAHADRLIKWMLDTKTGIARIRAGLPDAWRLGHKTGTAPQSAPCYNDVGIIFPPDQPPVLLAVYFDRPDVAWKEAEAVIAETTRLAAQKIVVK